jgi:hypothetical protein
MADATPQNPYTPEAITSLHQHSGMCSFRIFPRESLAERPIAQKKASRLQDYKLDMSKFEVTVPAAFTINHKNISRRVTIFPLTTEGHLAQPKGKGLFNRYSF